MSHLKGSLHVSKGTFAPGMPRGIEVTAVTARASDVQLRPGMAPVISKGRLIDSIDFQLLTTKLQPLMSMSSVYAYVDIPQDADKVKAALYRGEILKHYNIGARDLLVEQCGAGNMRVYGISLISPERPRPLQVRCIGPARTAPYAQHHFQACFEKMLDPNASPQRKTGMRPFMEALVVPHQNLKGERGNQLVVFDQQNYILLALPGDPLFDRFISLLNARNVAIQQIAPR